MRPGGLQVVVWDNQRIEFLTSLAKPIQPKKCHSERSEESSFLIT
jgi:hypothetical protein